MWSKNEDRLYYLGREARTMMAVDVSHESGELRVSAPQPLFDVPGRMTHLVREPNYDVARDGRFIVVLEDEDYSSPALEVVLNWASELD